MDLASLQLEIDSRKVQQAQKDLEGLAAAAEKTEAATDSLTQANKQSEDRYKAIARAAIERQQALNEEVRAQMASNNVTRQASEGAAERARAYTRVASAEHQARLENERQAAAMKAAAEAAERNQASLQKLLNQIDPLQGKLNRLDEMERQLTQTFRQGALDAETYAVSLAKIAGQRAAIGDQQLKQVAAGAKDAAGNMERLGLHTSQAHADLLSLGRAASSGDLSGASGSIMRLSRSTGIMSSAFSLAGISVLGLTAGVGALVAAYHQGQGEAERYNRAIIMTGNSAGVTSNDLAEMAARIGETEGGTRKAAQALTLFVGGGKIAKDNLESVTKAALAMSSATGRAIQETVSEFELIARDPVKAIETLHDRYGVLNYAIYEQARALVEQGRQQEAVNLITQTASVEMQQIATDLTSNLGTVERAWRGVWGWAGRAWDAMLNIGRPQTASQVTDHIKRLGAQIYSIDMSLADPKFGTGNTGGHDVRATLEANREQLLSKITELASEIEAEEGRIERAAKRAEENAGFSRVLEGSALISGLVKASKSDYQKAVDIENIRKATAERVSRDPLNAARYKQEEQIALAEIERRYKPRSGKQADTSEYRRTLQALTDDFRSANQVLDSERRANLVDEESYWQRKVELIDENERVQTAAMQSELARLAGVKNSTKQRADIEAQLAKVSKEAAKERQVAANQQIEAQNKSRIAVEAYIEALQELVRVEERAGQQRIAGMGMGTRERELQGSLDNADNKYASERLKLSRELAANKISDSQYRQMLAGLQSEHNNLRTTIITNYQQMREAESSFLLGATEGIANFVSESQNAYSQMASSTKSMFDGMFDAASRWSMGMDAKFSDVLKSYIQMMLKMQMQSAAAPFLSQAGGLLGGLLGLGLNIGAGAVSAMPGMSLNTTLGSMSNFTAIPFADGGFTGPGGRYEPAGIVHKGEGVLNQDEIRALGGEPGFNLLRRALRGPGHAIGGMGGRPSLPPAVFGGAKQQPSFVLNSVVHAAPGTNAAELGAMLEQRDAELRYQIYEELRRGRVEI